MFMHRAFERTGLDGSLNVVADGQQAIDYLAGKGVYADRREHPLPAVILLDLKLPVVSGFEVLAWLQRAAGVEKLARGGVFLLQSTGGQGHGQRIRRQRFCAETQSRTRISQGGRAAKATLAEEAVMNKGGNLPWSFAVQLRCSLLTGPCGYARRSRLAGRQNPGGFLPPLFITAS